MRPRVRALVPGDARAVATLTGAVAGEFGAETALSFQATVEMIEEEDWLSHGRGLVLTRESTLLGYGWARDAEWNGRRVVEFGLFLGPEARQPQQYLELTRPLLLAADDIGRRNGASHAHCHSRSIDHIHPPILRALGFHDLPTTMVGFGHDLRSLPQVQPPSELRIRPARLPSELGLLTSLQRLAFDNPVREGEPMEPGFFELIAGRPGFADWQVLVAELGDGPVGYAALINDPDSRDGASLLEIGVAPDHRRRSIGSAMILRLLERCRSARVAKVLTGCFSTNPGIGIYWRLGFRPDALRTYYFLERPLSDCLTSTAGRLH